MNPSIYLMPTKFTDVTSNHESYGIRIFSDDEAYYDNTWDSLPDTAEELLIKSWNCCDENIKVLIESAIVDQKSIMVGKKTIDCEQMIQLLEGGH